MSYRGSTGFGHAYRGALATHSGAALLYPLAAIVVCCLALPLARAMRRRADAASPQVVYRSLLLTHAVARVRVASERSLRLGRRRGRP